MYKLLFFAPNGKMTFIPCDTLDQAQEGRLHLPANSYFGIETPSGDIVEPAPECEQAVHIIQLLKTASTRNREQ